MKSILKIGTIAGLALGVVLSAMAQDKDKPQVTTAPSTKFAAFPGAPSCLTLSAQRGDPTKGAAVILAKATAGCKIPWHWHTASESLMFVAGRGKLEMKDAAAASTIGAGDFVYLPGKHVHQFTCLAACTFFDVTDGAFDLHYVDKDGKEIPPDQALKPAAKPAGKKK